MNSTDAYAVLAGKHMFPESKHYRRVLESLMTPRQAQMVALLPLSVEELAQKLNMDVPEIERELEVLFKKGVIIASSKGYKFAHTTGQLHDATTSPMFLDLVKDRDMLEAWQDFCETEYNEFLRMAMAFQKGPAMLRVVPARKALEGLEGVEPYEDAHQVIKAAESLAVCHCACKQRVVATRHECARTPTVDTCLQMNKGADYVIKRGSGRPISHEEAMQIVDFAEETGLIHQLPNSKLMNLNVMCNCCTDCCLALAPFEGDLELIGKIWEKSRYEASVDQDLCNGCQTCIERCPFDAIQMQKVEGSKKLKAKVDPEKCFGCGLCVITCEPHALKFKCVRSADHIPAEPYKYTV